MYGTNFAPDLWPLTWPVLPRDQTGGQDSVEQGHCTLAAVKRCRGAHAFADGLIFGSPSTS